MKKQLTLFFALAIATALSVPVLAQDFQSGDLLYEIISNDPPEVSLLGHVDGQNAQGELLIPETVEHDGLVYTVAEIRQSAFFRCGGLTGNLNIPGTVRAIRQLAFYECVGLTGTLVFPDSMRQIEIGAFTNCTGFTGTLSFPNSLMALGDYTGPFPGEYLPDYGTFEGCIGFDRLELPESLEFIGPSCFANCSNLKGQLTIPEGTKIIAENAFEHCIGFTGTLVIPESMLSVRDYAFMGCIGIEDVILPGHDVFYVYLYPSYYTENQLSYYVFSGCEGLTHVEIRDGLVKLGGRTFANCSNLVSVHLPESLRVIGSNCFDHCLSLSEINLPKGLTTIGNGAFTQCISLTHIVLPDSLTMLVDVFRDCSGLIGDMVVPDQVQKVFLLAFAGCEGLERVILGRSVNYVSEAAFENTQLESLVIRATTPPELDRSEYPHGWHFTEDIPIIVPCGTLEAYQNAEGWSEFTNIREGNTDFYPLLGTEWYFEIQNPNGSITYQYLEYTSDTTTNSHRAKVIVRTNKIYDKDPITVRTHEYIFEEDNVVYWWNKELQQFTVLYDFGADVGDEWEIKVGNESLVMHVDAIDSIEYEGVRYRTLRVSDVNDYFSGDIVCGIGHLTSFFPERLMSPKSEYRVEGLRCFWHEDQLVFKLGDKDCDEVYQSYHNEVPENSLTPDLIFTLSPNPVTNGILMVSIPHSAFRVPHYTISSLMGQPLLSGTISDEGRRHDMTSLQTIDVSSLSPGVYFITLGDSTKKFIIP